MDASWARAAGAVLLAVLLGLLLWQTVAGRRQQRRMIGRMQRSLERLDRGLSGTNSRVRALSDRQDALRDAIDARMDAMQSANDRRLGEIRETVGEKLDRRLTASFETVNRQLTEVHGSLGAMRTLAGEFSDLKRVLGGVKTRGIWGEAQLRALLEQMLAPGQYVENAELPAGSGLHVEFAIRLPAKDGECLLPVDSKFPQEDFLRLAEASQRGDAAETEACAAALERALTEQGRQISEKYIHPPETPDFAVMFLPVESLYAEAVRRNGLCEKLQGRYRVLVTGPNTLSALLTSLRMGFQTVQLEKRSSQVLRLFDELQEEFGAYEEAVGNVRRRLGQAASALDALERQSRKLDRRLKRLKDEEIPCSGTEGAEEPEI